MAYYFDPEGWLLDSGDDTMCPCGRCVGPLVVVNPESVEDRERFAAALWPKRVLTAHQRDLLAKRLREFANPTPPKPEEPTGRGAVVVDRYGGPWTRYSFSEPDDGEWINEYGVTKQWGELDLTEHAVLSRGGDA